MYGDYRIGYEKKEIESLSGNIIYGNDIRLLKDIKCINCCLKIYGKYYGSI